MGSAWKQDMVADALEAFPLVVWIDDDEQMWPRPEPEHLIKVTPDTIDGL